MSRFTKKDFSRLNFILFTVTLTSFGILFLGLPKLKVSEFEKRPIDQMPSFSWKGFWHGTYDSLVEAYYADNFPFRENFVEMSKRLEAARGFRPDVAIIQNVAVDKQVPKDVDTTVAGVDSVPADTASSSGPGETDMGGGLLLYNEHAMEVFGGTKAMAKYFASAINSYAMLYPSNLNIYCVAVPSSIAFNANDDYAKNSLAEKTNIDQIYSNLAPWVKRVDVWGEIAAHKNEYCYFRTDHHWTGLGAYYGYVAFCKSAGMTPIELSAMTHKVKPNYLGSLYAFTKDERIKEFKDSVEYWMVPGNHKTYRYGESNTKAMPGSLYAEGAKGGNSYGVFLGGDNPLMRIDNPDIKNGRKVCIVKNSYGNPFSTYFTANFEQVFVLDYRYYKGSIIDLIKDNGITDLVFINGIFSANTSWHIKMMTKIMKAQVPGKPKDVPFDSVPSPADSAKHINPDSLKKKPVKKK